MEKLKLIFNFILCRLFNRGNKHVILRNKSTKNSDFGKLDTKSNPLSTRSSLSEVDNFSLRGIIDAISYDKAIQITRRNKTLPVECVTKQFLISEEGEINSVFDMLKHEEYIDVDASALR